MNHIFVITIILLVNFESARSMITQIIKRIFSTVHFKDNSNSKLLIPFIIDLLVENFMYLMNS